MGFLSFSFIDFLDIFFVALIIYFIYNMLKGSVAISIFLGILLIAITWKITEALKMEMMSSILSIVGGGGVFMLIIVFQQEIRRILLRVGKSQLNYRERLNNFRFFSQNQNLEWGKENIKKLIMACNKLSVKKIGALIVIEKDDSLDFIKETGDSMQVVINIPIIESIFFKNSPLHDGAIIVKDNKINTTRAILPLSKRKIHESFGLRHRAAIGLTEDTDARCLVVSEETGKISAFSKGKSIPYKNIDQLIIKLSE